jgi:ParB family chromosome partitioning protein
MAIKKGLGRGFDSLVPGGTNLEAVITPKNEKIHNLAIDIVKPKSNQPRRNFDEQLLQQLAQSIKEQGILQPIVVTETEHNIYSIIAGERRWRAANLAGLNTIPAIIKKVDELQHLELALLENVQRSDLNAIETALTINRLHNEFQQSYEQIAIRLGKAYTTVVNTSRLLSLPKNIQESIASGNISEGHGRALLSLTSQPTAQLKLYNLIISNKLSVRQAEEHASKLKNKKNGKDTKKVTTVLSSLEQSLSTKFGVQVKVSKSTKKGTIILKYSSNKDYQTIINKLKS